MIPGRDQKGNEEEYRIHNYGNPDLPDDDMRSHVLLPLN
jgi:hypothetical protein